MADESSKAKRTVWILGSGFSRALGGPLLDELLSQSALLELQLAHPDLERRSEFAEAQQMYAFGVASGFWKDAETFLDRIDVAGRQSNSAPGRQIRIAYNGSSMNPLGDDVALATQTFARLSGEARRFVALQCSRFTDSYDEGLESWRAYRSWAEKLTKPGALHTILTFNYDSVLEKLTGFTIPKPHDEAILSRLDSGIFLGGLKLHGSVGWTKVNDHYEDATTSWDLHSCDPSGIAIATPGPYKFECVKVPLEPLWRAGLAAIKRADSIIFIGYRFPPSDAVARTYILGAIGENKAKSELTLNIVLGPKLGSDDNVRLRALLQYTAENGGRVETARDPDMMHRHPQFTIREHPLLAEDFLTVWEPRLTGSV